MNGSNKVKPHHLEREACLYIRQSSIAQVMNNTESSRRQYGLQRKARSLGWSRDRIRTIDEDQGKSGRSSVGRHGFQDLSARLAAGEVGIILTLELSRLGRSNADLQRLFFLASAYDTLILDEAGIYDLNCNNDRLLPERHSRPSLGRHTQQGPSGRVEAPLAGRPGLRS